MSKVCDFCGKKEDNHKDEQDREIFVCSNTLDMKTSLPDKYYKHGLKFDTCDNCGGDLVSEILKKIRKQNENKRRSRKGVKTSTKKL